MHVFQTPHLNALRTFAHRSEKLAIVTRDVPTHADVFFQSLREKRFEVMGKVRQHSLVDDIRSILDTRVLSEVPRTDFYTYWLYDMARLCELFYAVQGEDTLHFWLGSKRGCPRYHIDHVPFRMLVTYFGQGTEWLPDEAADRDAFAAGGANTEIMRDKTRVKFMAPWDVAIFRGGQQGVLHRTPDAALKGQSILMRLDRFTY